VTMASFTDPFPGIQNTRPMGESDLVRALRLDLAAEEEAIHLYTAHADATDNFMVRVQLLDIANEERRHVGELLTLIQTLTKDESKFLEEGTREVKKKFPDLTYKPWEA